MENQNESAMSTLNRMPSNKSEVIHFTSLIKASIIDGNQDPIKAAIQIAALEKVVKAVRADADIRNTIMSELEKHGKSSIHLGNELSLCETGIKWRYANDETLINLEAEKKAIDDKIKARQKMLQALDRSVADPESGEMLMPAIKESMSNYKIILR
jgi:hypothetical protein